MSNLNAFIEAGDSQLWLSDPFSLTNDGQIASSVLYVKHWATHAAAQLISRIPDRYSGHIQEFAVDYIQSWMDSFNDPAASIATGYAKDNSLRIEAVMGIYAVELRDALLELIDQQRTMSK